jgi:c-di-GMP-binding flagellar brake protein YcgR
MELAEKAEELGGQGQERRTAPRHGVDEVARLLLVKHGSTVPCRVMDLSLNGCRLSTPERFLAGILVRVEVAFMVRGFAFRFCGVTQWTDGRQQVGIRFVDVPMRRREELAEALAEVKAQNAAKAAKQAADEQVAEQLAEEQRTAPAAVPQAKAVVVAAVPVAASRIQADRTIAPAPQSAQTQRGPLLPAAPPPPKPSKRERRTQSRHGVDTSAVIYLINIAARLQGRILDLSLSGCRIRTDDRFPVGIYTRVETEFRLEGLPFRLGGVIQSIHDKHHVGIRFLDMSPRKREQVEQLIEEIEELKERKAPDEPSQTEPGLNAPPPAGSPSA